VADSCFLDDGDMEEKSWEIILHSGVGSLEIVVLLELVLLEDLLGTLRVEAGLGT
jgi:hypothetical protein